MIITILALILKLDVIFTVILLFKKEAMDKNSLDIGIIKNILVKASYFSAHVGSSLNWNLKKNRKYTFTILIPALKS